MTKKLCYGHKGSFGNTLRCGDEEDGRITLARIIATQSENGNPKPM